jgi:hypothetical protein
MDSSDPKSRERESVRVAEARTVEADARESQALNALRNQF